MTTATSLTTNCTAEQAAVLQRNEWKVVAVGGVRLRIHPPSSDVAVVPSGPVHYTASVGVAGESAANESPGDAESQAVVAELFGGEI